MALPFCLQCWPYNDHCICNQIALQPVVISFTDGIFSAFTTLRRPSRISPVRIGVSDQVFVNACFPQPEQGSERMQLANLLQEPWLLFDYEEPSGAFKFLLKETEQGNQQCAICLKVCRRGARALEHIRIHLDHKPFRCLGSVTGCSQPNCERVFHGRESMRDHQRKSQAQCNMCQITILRKNLRRHLQSHAST